MKDKRVYNNVVEAIGNTPLIKMNNVTKEIPAEVFAKVEFFNPGNSIKDRIAVKLIEDAEKKGLIKPGGTIVEGTSGNTGMGLALVGIVKGYKCIFTTNDKQSKEKIDILKAVGAEVIVCPTDVEPDDPRSYYSVAQKIADETPNSFYVNQYFNLSNRVAHYETTGPEIWEQTDGKITHLVVGVGTGGTISGTAKYLKEKNPDIKILGIDSYGSALKKYHETGIFDENEVYSYVTEGIGEDIIPDNIDFSVIDHFEKVTDKDGAILARRITKEEGLFCGYSAGSAVAGLLQMKDKFKKGDVVVVVFHDSGSRYVAKIYNDAWMRERQFLDEEDQPLRARDIISGKKQKEVMSVLPNNSVRDVIKLMKDYDLSQLPVMEKNKILGSVTEGKLLNALIENPGKSLSVKDFMGVSFPEVKLNTTDKEISKLINRDNSAVMVRDLVGEFQIITEYDLIQAIAEKV
ncbi:MAG: pyridoxal-phosphate dependent enzyme [Chitinophagales bacterium]